MLKKLIDTNIFIDRFSTPDLYKDIFLSEGLVYLSSVVLMELKAGAHSKEAVCRLGQAQQTQRIDGVKISRLGERLKGR